MQYKSTAFTKTSNSQMFTIFSRACGSNSDKLSWFEIL